MAPICSNCNGTDFVWANELKTGMTGGGSLSIRSRGDLPLGTRICRTCGHADLFLRDISILHQPHLWRPGEFIPIVAKTATKPAHASSPPPSPPAPSAPTVAPAAAVAPPPPPPPPTAPVPPPTPMPEPMPAPVVAEPAESPAEDVTPPPEPEPVQEAPAESKPKSARRKGTRSRA